MAVIITPILQMQKRRRAGEETHGWNLDSSLGLCPELKPSTLSDVARGGEETWVECVVYTVGAH